MTDDEILDLDLSMSGPLGVPRTAPASALAESKIEVMPEIVRNSMSRTAFVGALDEYETEDELDVRMLDLMQRAEPENPRANRVLRNYRDYRQSRGEEAFQHLERGQERVRQRSFAESLPFFAKLFTDYESAFPETERASIAAEFRGPLAAQAKQQAANKALVGAMTKTDPATFGDRWPIVRTTYAKAAFGWDGEGAISDEEFHGLASAAVTKENTDRTHTNSMARRARAAVVEGKPLKDLLASAEPEFHQVIRDVYASTFEQYDDKEIILARAAYERDVAKFQGTYTEPTEEAGTIEKDKGLSIERQFAALPVEQRDRVRTLMGYMAAEDGWDVKGFFAKVGGSIDASTERISKSRESSQAKSMAEKIAAALESGLVRDVPGELRTDTGLFSPRGKWTQAAGGQGISSLDPLNPRKALTDEERSLLERVKAEAEAEATYLGDMATSGVRVARHLDEEQDGFWMRSALFAAGSLPEMGLAVLPYGAGLPIIYGSRRAEAVSNFERSAPGASSDQIERMATATALGQTAVLSMERFILGARLPNTGVSLKSVENGLANFAARGSWRTAAVVPARVGIVVGFEMVQENVENLMPAMVQQVAAGLSKDIPGPDWKKIYQEQKEVQADIFGASLIFGVIAGTGRAVGDYVQGPALREAMTDTSGMRLTGISEADAMRIAELAETNPIDAAEAYRETLEATPIEQRKENAATETARVREAAKSAEANRQLGIPEIVRNEDGSATVKWNNLLDEESTHDSPESALDAIKTADIQEQVDISKFNRAEIEAMVTGQTNDTLAQIEAGLPGNLRINSEWTPSQTLEEWAGNNEAKIKIAKDRITYYLRSAANDFGLVPKDGDLGLSQYFIEGSSTNIAEGDMVTIAIKLADGSRGGRMATPLTAIEEVSEGVSKHLRSNGMPVERQIGWLRHVERETNNRLIEGDLTGLEPEAVNKQVDEALARVSIGYAVGKISDSQAPSGLLNYLRAFKEWLHGVLKMAKDIKNFMAKNDGKLDPEFVRFLETATGFNEGAIAERSAVDADTRTVEDAVAEIPGDPTFAISRITEAGFYSRLEEVVLAKVSNNSTPAQVMATLDPQRGSGVKAEEIKWSGIEQALERIASENGGKVPKAALVEYLENEGRVQFQEVVAQDEPVYSIDRDLQDSPDGEGVTVFTREEAIDYLNEKAEEVRDGWRGEISSDPYAIDEDGDLTEADNTDYPPVAWRVDLTSSQEEFTTKEEAQKRLDEENEWINDESALVNEENLTLATHEGDVVIEMQENGKTEDGQTKFGQYVLPGGENYREVVLAMPEKKGESYTSTHFPDVPNYVAHMRTNERDDAEGKPGMFIEEIQSDRHQAGRKSGYKITPERKAELDKIVSEIGGRFDTATAEEKTAFTEAVNEQTRGANGIAPAPFQTTWPLAMFKRAFRDAVASRKSWIGWTVGETQNDRFDLSKQVSEILAVKNGDTYDITAYDLEDTPLNLPKNTFAAQELPDFIGKELAEKVVRDLDGKDDGTESSYAGYDLKVGGSGMKGFYDVILPKEIGKYVKQWGGKVEKSRIDAESHSAASLGDAARAERLRKTLAGESLETTPIWRIDITPEMKAGVEAGQPTFALSTGQSLLDAIEQQIRDPEPKANVWRSMRERVAAVKESSSSRKNLTQWITIEDQETALSANDGARESEVERHLAAMQNLRQSADVAAQEARASLMGELGTRYEEADAKHRQSLNRLTRERVKVVEQQFARKMDAERSKHRQNLAAIAANETSLIRRGRESDKAQSRLQQLQDIATLEAIGKALPRELRGIVVGSFRKLTEMPNAAKREDYILSLIPKIEKAVEANLVKQLKASINKRLAAARPKVSDSRTATGTIGDQAHDVFQFAEEAMPLTMEEAEARAEKIRDEIDNAESLDIDELERLDTKQAILETLYDFEKADSARLDQALTMLNEIYTEGRREWLQVLEARRDRREYLVQTIARGLGRDRRVETADRARSERESEGIFRRIGDLVMSAMNSGSQNLRRLSENTDDIEVKSVVDKMDEAFAESQLKEVDLNRIDNINVAAALRSILRVSTDYALAKRLHELTQSKGDVPVTRIEGITPDIEISIPLEYAEDIASGAISGFTRKKKKGQVSEASKVELDSGQVDLVRQELARFEALDDESRKGVRSLKITPPGNKGERKSLGPINQLEALQFYLTLNQPDQAAQMESIGYDQQTMDELRSYLKPQVMELGDWMVNYLKNDQGEVDSIHRFERGIGLGLVENYFPVRKDVARADNTGLDLKGMQMQQGGRSIGFIKGRVENNAEIAIANALGVFLAHRAQVNFWKSHVAAMREYGGVIRNETFASAVRSRMGREYYKTLTRLLDRIESGGRLNAQQQLDFENVVKTMMKSFALGTLGMRVSTLLVNTSAIMNPVFEVPASELLKGAAQVMKRPQAFRDAWNSPAIKRRLEEGSSFEAQLAKSKGPSDNPILAVLNRAAEPGMNAINIVDTGTNTITAAAAWEYTKNQAIRSGMSEASAKAAADRKVEEILRRAAQPTLRMSRSEIELRALDNPLSALFALFISEPRKNFAITYMAARQLITGKGNYSTAMAAQQLALGIVIYTAVEFTIRSFYAAFANAKPEEEDELWARFSERMTDPKALGYKMTTSHLTGIPIFGAGWDFAMARLWDQHTFGNDNNPVTKLFKTADKMGVVLDDEKTVDQRTEGAIRVTQGLGSGLPGGPIFAQLANLIDFAHGVATSSGVDLSEQDKINRYKARFSKANKEINELYGPTDGDKLIQRQKRAAQIEVITSMLEGVPAADREKILDELPVSKDAVKNRVKRSFGKSAQ